MNAEMVIYIGHDMVVNKLQWGRVRMNAEIPEDSCSTRAIAKLQWGRVRMNAEIYPRGVDEETADRFNGAAFG